MALTELEAIEIIKAPLNSKLINSVKMQESQLRVFTEELDEFEIKQEPYYLKLMGVMESRSRDKYQRICDFMRFPLPIVEDSDSILNDFYKVFDGKNRYFNVSADRDISKLNLWVDEYKLEHWIEKEIKDVWKKKPNSFVVIDYDNNSPYLISIDSSRLHDAKFKDKSGQLSYIVFVHSIEQDEINNNVTITKYAVYDEETYFVFQKRSDSDEIINISQVSHNIGYCPAHSFINDCSTESNKFKRRVAFSKSLSRLEDYTIYDVWGNYLDSYAPFPVTEAPKSKCSDSQCEGGKVPEQVVTNVATGDMKTIWNDCKTCDGGKNDGKLIGPGTHIGIDVIDQGNDGSGVFKMHFPEAENLKLIPEKLDNLLIHVKNSVVGVNGMVSKEAINELQAKGGFESMESVIHRNKEVLEHIYKWIVSTVGKVLYKDLSLEVDANFGTEWYLSTEEDLQKKFEQAKNIGLPHEELMMIYVQLIETKYKGNNDKILRQKMLIKLDPLPLISIPEALELNSKGFLSDDVLLFKINFLNFINRFESENAPITQFGSALEMPKRIQTISKTLNLYINEVKTKTNDSQQP